MVLFETLRPVVYVYVGMNVDKYADREEVARVGRGRSSVIYPRPYIIHLLITRPFSGTTLNQLIEHVFDVLTLVPSDQSRCAGS